MKLRSTYQSLYSSIHCPHHCLPPSFTFLLSAASSLSSSIIHPISLSHGNIRAEAYMTMASLRPLFSNLISLFLLLIHLGCFIFTSNPHPSKKRKTSALSPSSSSLKLKTTKALSSSWTFLKRIVTHKPANTHTHPNLDIPSPSLSATARSSLHSSIVQNETLDLDTPRERPPVSRPECDISSDQQFFPLRNDIYPCPACGEIFQNPSLLEQHQAIKHAVSELIDGDSGKNIVQIIFRTGWPEKEKNPNILRVLKVHSSPKILTRFEEYRESVKLRAARSAAVRRRDERCIADGNELLRFHCSTFLCDLGRNGNSTLCNNQYCSVCGIVTLGFSPKMDGISTLSTSWRAHVAIPDEMVEEFGFMGVKRAMLVCRVIAGRVGCDPEFVDKEDPGVRVGRGQGARAAYQVR